MARKLDSSSCRACLINHKLSDLDSLDITYIHASESWISRGTNSVHLRGKWERLGEGFGGENCLVSFFVLILNI